VDAIWNGYWVEAVFVVLDEHNIVSNPDFVSARRLCGYLPGYLKSH
jgi:hypothetical protein